MVQNSYNNTNQPCFTLICAVTISRLLRIFKAEFNVLVFLLELLLLVYVCISELVYIKTFTTDNIFLCIYRTFHNESFTNYLLHISWVVWKKLPPYKPLKRKGTAHDVEVAIELSLLPVHQMSISFSSGLCKDFARIKSVSWETEDGKCFC